MRRLIIMLLALMIMAPAVSAQSERRCVRKGNRQFSKEHYSQAEIDYKKALLADSLSSAAHYNLGNTYYRMDDAAQAQKSLEAAVDSLAGTKYGADAYHNLGNALLKQENYQGAIDAYKNSLRRRPDDMETKTNLAYAIKKLQEQQDQNQDNQDQNQDQNQDNQNNQDQNDQNQDNKDQNQDQNKDNQDQNKDQNKDQDKNDDKQDQNQDQQNQNQDQNQNNDSRNNPGDGQAPPPKISQQDAQQILQAIQDKENETQEKVKAEKALLLKSRQKDKNW